MTAISVFQRVFRTLASRKARVALSTVAAGFAAEFGWDVSDELVFTILGVGVALILGIAYEDAGRSIAKESGDGR